MKNQAFNPYLPEYEYIPDGEPYIFGDRVYVYGSHDRFGAPMFCMNDYVCWSAPANDLSDWRYEGVIYKKTQDPRNKFGLRLLFAPDITVGPDGRYYLYYALDFMGIMGVAVCDSPAGRFEFYGYIRYTDGTIWGRRKGDSFPFDPGIFVDDDRRVYLYSGFYTPVPSIITGLRRLEFKGGYVLELEQDMLTIKMPQKLLFPKEGVGAFQNHEFFEASSMRKIKEKYYFVYSSRHNHELCYAIGKSPTGGFKFGGTLVSNGDVLINGQEDEAQAANYLGNTHGGLLELDGRYYIFYHRHTNRCSYARQACAEQLIMEANGHFQQAELTSCGLNQESLRGRGRYPARIACHLWSKEGTGRYDIRFPKKKFAKHPYFTQDKKDGDKSAVQYVANMRDGAVAGFKYFDIVDVREVAVTVRGSGEGEIVLSTHSDFHSICARIPILPAPETCTFSAESSLESGKQALYFRYEGCGEISFYSFELRTR